MQNIDERGVQQGEHAIRIIPRELPDWDAARVFLAVVRKGSLRGAAQKLALSINVVRDRISKFEKAIGVTLFTRHVHGVRLTPEGEAMLAAVSRMETAAFDVVRVGDQSGPDIAGEVRLAVTEGLGTYWIIPHLIEFQRTNPKLFIDLNCAAKSADVLRLEADIAVQLTRPSVQDLRVVKLGRLHFMFFGSESYLKAAGYPKTSTDLIKHRILIQADDNDQWYKLYDKLFPGMAAAGLVAIRANVSSAHYWSIVGGGGIGILPTYSHIIGAPLIPLDIGVHEAVDIWLTFHPDVNRIERVRRVIDWIIQSFSPQIFPWFRDEFIHPRDFSEKYRGPTLPKLLANVVRTNEATH